MASKSGLVEPVDPVEPVAPVKSITEAEEILDTDGQDSIMDEVVNKSLKKKSVLELKAPSALKAASDYDVDVDETGSIAKGNFVESSIKQALKIKHLE